MFWSAQTKHLVKGFRVSRGFFMAESENSLVSQRIFGYFCADRQDKVAKFQSVTIG